MANREGLRMRRVPAFDGQLASMQHLGLFLAAARASRPGRKKGAC
jgi:hypothetical protein